MRVIFLDIDGVLYTRKAGYLPANRLLYESMAEVNYGPRDVAIRLAFDPCAVALVNRLAETAEASLVLISDWRRVVGFEETYEKLVEQGVDSKHFHAAWDAAFFRDSSKAADVLAWVERHKPSRYLVLDDDDLGGDLPQVRTTWEEGLTISLYRHAHEILGTTDLALKVTSFDERFPELAAKERKEAYEKAWTEGLRGKRKAGPTGKRSNSIGKSRKKPDR
jgi:hypothetical protein